MSLRDDNVAILLKQNERIALDHRSFAKHPRQRSEYVNGMTEYVNVLAMHKAIGANNIRRITELLYMVYQLGVMDGCQEERDEQEGK